MKTDNYIQAIVAGLPENPGVYQYYDSENRLLYVGKAKNLKKRVSSYFTKTHDSNKTNIMVKQIADIKFIVVETEYDALLLENNLIKKHQPRYNVSLKDDKTYPWIVIKNERFPRVFYTRKFIRDGSQYFGPYASVGTVHVMMGLVEKLFKLRNCNLKLSKENIEKKKFKVCLEYHIGNCKGPCEALQTELDYNNTISEIKEILKGNIYSVINHLKEQMQQFAESYKYEEAQQMKSKITLLEGYQSKSVVVHPTIHNVDVFSIINDDKTAFVNYLKIINGGIIQAQTIELKKKLEETSSELLALAIAELRQRYNSTSAELLVSEIPEMEIEGATFTVPKIGDKKHLIELSLKNAFYYRREKLNQLDKLNPEHRTERILTQMMKDLRLKQLPVHIECFDNSNFQGAYPVAAMSVFKDAKPSKKDYRHFNIKTVEGPDDFASMEEVISRRYKRMLDEKQSLPQLIIIDGGKGQLSSAVSSLKKLNLTGKIAVIGIAKKLEEIYYPNDSIPLYLDKKGETLKIIQHLRDEVHRFGITHHRKRRNKGVIKTELAQIKGIGEATARALLKHFKSVKKIREAGEDELKNVIGKSKAKMVMSYFHS
ncbi:MAG: excinuclease ABC subunit UvrC [Bacteroidia bacterium]